MATNTVNLPQGFELEKQDQISGLPPGFQLEGSDKTPSLPAGFELESQSLTAGFELDGPSITDQSTGYLNNVRDPVSLMKNESFVSNIFNIITGNTDAMKDKEKRKYQLDPVLQNISNELGEMEQQGKSETPEYDKLYQSFLDTQHLMDSEPEFSLSALKEAFTSDPGGTLAEFQNALVADPELLLTPLGWEKAATMAATKLAKTSKTIQTLGKTTAGATGAATAGAAIIAPLSSRTTIK